MVRSVCRFEILLSVCQMIEKVTKNVRTLPSSCKRFALPASIEPTTQERIGWLSDSHTSKPKDPTEYIPEQQPPPCRGDVGEILSTRKRVPGFSIGLPITASSPKTNPHGGRRLEKKGRGYCKGSGGGDSGSEARAARAWKLGAHEQQQQQQASDGRSGDVLPCRACRSEVNSCWRQCTQRVEK